VTVDIEIETWRREWQSQTEPLPKLKRKIQRQNLRTVASIVVMCACLAVSTIEAFRTRSSFVEGLASGLWFTALVLGGYIWWVQRGAWRPAAQTTQAYLQLSYLRAVAKARTLRFSIYFLLAALVVLTPLLLWSWRTLHTTAALILAALVAELIVFRRLERRKKQEIAETKKLLEQSDERSDFVLGER
jgi:hypothetical protein